jgi:hypothetical protein
MFRKLLFILLTQICAIVLLNSCSTDTLLISELQPASVYIPGNIKRVSIFPLAGIPDPPGIFDSISHILLDPANNYNITKKGYLYGVYEVMASSPRFQKITIADSSFVDSVFSGTVSWDILKEICRHDSTDAVLIIKKIVAYDSIQYLEESRKKLNTASFQEYPRYPEESYYSCTFLFRLISNTKWAFYQPAIQTKSVQFSFTDTIDFYGDNRCENVFSPDSMQEILYSACFYTGKKVGERLAPVWDDAVQRFLYIGQNKNLRDAARFIKKNQWVEAGQIWNTLSEDKNKRSACKASFNMALAWERADDLDQAFSWITYADSLFSNSKTLAYKKILKKRLETRDLLDKQMTGN